MLPKGWGRVTVEESCSVVSVGIVVTPSHYYVQEHEGIKAFRSQNVRENQVNEQNWAYISAEGQAKNAKSILKSGDVVIVRTGFAGTACVVPPHLDGSNCIDILFARPKPELLLPEYLCELTNSDLGRRQVLNGQSGLAQKHLNVSAYEKLSFPLPPISEQRQLIELFGTWNDSIATTEKVLANCRRQKQALMLGLLSGKHRFDSPSGAWYYLDFDQIFERVKQKNSVGNDNVLTISGQHGLISQREFFNKSVASENLFGYTLLERGDFAYNKSYSNGYPMGAIKPLLAYDAGVVSSLYLCFRLRSDVDADLDFFRHYFEAGLLNEEISGIAQEGARNHGLLNVSVADFFKLRLHVPPAPVQRKIAEAINAAEAEERLMEQQLHRLQMEKRALMQQLLTGKRRVRLHDHETVEA